MKSGYDQFFKNAKRAAAGEKAEPAMKMSFSNKAFDQNAIKQRIAQDLEKNLRSQMHTKKKRKAKPTPWKMIMMSMMGLAIAGVGLWKIDTIERVIKNVEITMMGSAHAEDAPAAAAPVKEAAPAAAEPAKKEYTAEEINHFSKLNERKRELDAREEELNRAEGELQAQRAELEKKLSELETTRRGISSVLEEKVKTDEAKVETLVQMYSNMKAQQAAKVFETMDENLAIEILGRMKKKNAAEIMGFVKPEKVQVLTEKFAGYKN